MAAAEAIDLINSGDNSIDVSWFIEGKKVSGARIGKNITTLKKCARNGARVSERDTWRRRCSSGLGQNDCERERFRDVHL